MRKLLKPLAVVALLTSVACAEAPGRSEAKIILAGPPSMWDRQAVAVVFNRAIDKASLSDAKNFSFEPFLIVESAAADAQQPNVARLRLSSETPLDPTRTYEVRLKSGVDAEGKSLDPYLLHKSFHVHTIDAEIDNILRHQLPDGAVSVSRTYQGEWRHGEGVRVIPYFSCFALAGLLRGATVVDDPRGIEATRLYLLWHEEHMGEHGYINDYRGAFPNYPSTGDFDSTDSYGAFFAWLNWSYYLHTGDDAFLRARGPAVIAAAGAIDSTMQGDGLTWAKPSYHVKYTMDNAEVFRGYFTASQIARYLGDKPHYDEWKAKAYKVRDAIRRELFIDDGKTPPHYAIGKMNDDSFFDDWKLYYPSGMANDLPLLCTHYPTDERSKLCWSSVKSTFLKDDVPADGVEWFMPRVASMMGDRTAQDVTYLKAIEMHEHENLSLNSGHLLELTYTDRPYAVRARRTVLGADAWRDAPALHFHVLGPMVGFDNLVSSQTDVAAEQKDSVYTMRFVHDEKSLRIRVRAIDSDIIADKTPGYGDGLSRLFIRGPRGLVETPVTIVSKSGKALEFSNQDGVTATGEATDQGYSVELAVNLEKVGVEPTAEGIGSLEFAVETQDVGTSVEGKPISVKLGLAAANKTSRLLLNR